MDIPLEHMLRKQAELKKPYPDCFTEDYPWLADALTGKDMFGMRCGKTNIGIELMRKYHDTVCGTPFNAALDVDAEAELNVDVEDIVGQGAKDLTAGEEKKEDDEGAVLVVENAVKLEKPCVSANNDLFPAPTGQEYVELMPHEDKGPELNTDVIFSPTMQSIKVDKKDLKNPENYHTDLADPKYKAERIHSHETGRFPCEERNKEYEEQNSEGENKDGDKE